jgi:hypothetical protein
LGARGRPAAVQGRAVSLHEIADTMAFGQIAGLILQPA